MLLFICFLFIWLSAYLSEDKQKKSFYRIVLIGFILRAALAICLFFICTLNIPIMKSLHIGTSGFWYFAPDSFQTHKIALGYYLNGPNNPDFKFLTQVSPSGHVLWVFFVAYVYKIFGPSPLNFLMLNTFIASLQILLAIRIMQKIDTEKNAARGGLLLAFWPSLVLWSTQILKDTLCIFLITIAIYMIVFFLYPDENTYPAKRAYKRILTYCVWLAAFFFLLKIRLYSGIILFSSWILTLFFLSIRELVRMKFRKFYFYGACAVIFAVLFFFFNGIKISVKPPEATLTNVALIRNSLNSDIKIDKHLKPKTYQKTLSLEKQTEKFFSYSKSLFDFNKVQLVRDGFNRTGGASLLRAGDTRSDRFCIIKCLPISLAASWLAPFPWEWFEKGKETDGFKILAGLEMLTFYIFVPALLWGWLNFIKTQRLGIVIFCVLFVILNFAILGIAVPNIGTLFRLRSQFLFLFLIVGLRGLEEIHKPISFKGKKTL